MAAKKINDQLENDYERMVPEFHRNSLIYAEHTTRYEAAVDIVKGKVVLDIASGSGYGTKMLAQTAKYVYGVDVNEVAINYSKRHYNAENIEYVVGDGEEIPLGDKSVDIVVTFETIEHIQDYQKFIKEIRRVLKDDGIAIISTPNDAEFAEGNHFHLHEFEYDELTNLLKEEFSEIDSYFQATWKYVGIDRSDSINHEGYFNTAIQNLAPTDVDKCLYFYLLCSNRKITEVVKPIAALGEHYSDRKMAEDLGKHRDHIYQLEKIYKELKNKKENLEKDMEYQRNETVQLREEIEKIKKSKAYAYANRLRTIKHKVSPRK